MRIFTRLPLGQKPPTRTSLRDTHLGKRWIWLRLGPGNQAKRRENLNLHYVEE